MSRPILLLSLMLDQGGSERQLAETALALDRKRFSPHFGMFRTGCMREAELRAAEVPMVHFPVTSFRKPNALQGAWRMAKYIREHDFQVMHAFDSPLSVLSSPIVKFFSKSTLMVPSQRGNRKLTPAFRQPLRVADRWADRIVVNCE